ncbi:hypothetical protein BJ912DRAFT_1068337 [Pholiota molesta]|nr:hypothetical protein BJ912DRAFT_1068337 [Pholiota molesta]
MLYLWRLENEILMNQSQTDEKFHQARALPSSTQTTSRPIGLTSVTGPAPRPHRPSSLLLSQLLLLSVLVHTIALPTAAAATFGDVFSITSRTTATVEADRRSGAEDRTGGRPGGGRGEAAEPAAGVAREWLLEEGAALAAVEVN